MELKDLSLHIKTIYMAARLAPLNANDHEQVQRSALEIEKFLKDLESKEDNQKHQKIN